MSNTKAARELAERVKWRSFVEEHRLEVANTLTALAARVEELERENAELKRTPALPSFLDGQRSGGDAPTLEEPSEVSTSSVVSHPSPYTILTSGPIKR